MSYSTDTKPRIYVKKLSDDAILPIKVSSGSAGYDLSSPKDCVVPAHGKLLIPTNLAISIPSNTYARIAPRSGLANKYFIDVGAGVIDSDYSGNVGVILFNHSDEQFQIKAGDRIAQLILEVIIPDAIIEEVSELCETGRGGNGFGSSGVAKIVS